MDESAPTATDESAPGGGLDHERRLRIKGIHHITAICADRRRTTAFYRDLLGMTLVREAENLDDPGAAHLFFADPAGTPGTMITFLEYPSMEPGVVGTGSTHHFALRVGTPLELEGWRDYLRAHGVECTDPLDREFCRSIYLRDPDGHVVEIATDAPVAPVG